MIVDAFAKIGPSSIPALADKIKSGTKDEKKDALFYLGKLTEKLPLFGDPLSPEDKKEIQAILKKAIADENYEVRESTIQAIGNSLSAYSDEDKRELIKFLGSVSRSDPYFVRRKVEDKEGTIYPIRDKAAALLKKVNP